MLSRLEGLQNGGRGTAKIMNYASDGLIIRLLFFYNRTFGPWSFHTQSMADPQFFRRSWRKPSLPEPKRNLKNAIDERQREEQSGYPNVHLRARNPVKNYTYSSPPSIVVVLKEDSANASVNAHLFAKRKSSRTLNGIYTTGQVKSRRFKSKYHQTRSSRNTLSEWWRLLADVASEKFGIYRC